MRKSILYLIGFLVAVSCQETTSENTMVLTGKVKGLKKGTLYLQHISDSTLVNLDSLVVNGDGSFRFETPLDSPEVFYLYLNKNDANDFNDRISFFGEPGTVTINSSWNTFDTDAKITGSETQKKLEEYRRTMSRFNTKNLEIIQSAASTETKLDSLQLDSLQSLSNNNVKRSYAFALNFALNNKDSYIAPYIALNEVADANVVYLDSIYNSLSPEVADSKYGKLLEAHVKEIKAKE